MAPMTKIVLLLALKPILEVSYFNTFVFLRLYMFVLCRLPYNVESFSITSAVNYMYVAVTKHYNSIILIQGAVLTLTVALVRPCRLHEGSQELCKLRHQSAALDTSVHNNVHDY